jgi:hypothetical protein
MMRMMSSLLVVARVVVLGGLAMMVCGILVVLGRDLVVAAALVRLRAHDLLRRFGSCRAGETAPVV